MLVTLAGMLTLSKPLQLANVHASILVTRLGIVTLFRLLQPLNADPPMLVTLSEMVTRFRLLLWDNAGGISYYKRCGFKEEELIPLKRVEAQGEITWVPWESTPDRAEKYYLHMRLC